MDFHDADCLLCRLPHCRLPTALLVEPARRRRRRSSSGPAGWNQPSAWRTNDCTTTSPRWASMTTDTSLHGVSRQLAAMASSVLTPKTSAPTA